MIANDSQLRRSPRLGRFTGYSARRRLFGATTDEYSCPSGQTWYMGQCVSSGGSMTASDGSFTVGYAVPTPPSSSAGGCSTGADCPSGQACYMGQCVSSGGSGASSSSSGDNGSGGSSWWQSLFTSQNLNTAGQIIGAVGNATRGSSPSTTPAGGNGRGSGPARTSPQPNKKMAYAVVGGAALVAAFLALS